MRFEGRLNAIERRFDRSNRFKSADILDRLIPRNFRHAGRPRYEELAELCQIYMKALPRVKDPADRERILADVGMMRITIACDTDDRAVSLYWTMNNLRVAKEHFAANPDDHGARQRIADGERELAKTLSEMHAAPPEWLPLFIGDDESPEAAK
jgi:hypothetical protein